MSTLRSNRNFALLQIGQLLSSTGSQSATIAYPLLVLALSHSAAKAGLISFARVLPLTVLSLPAGVLADRIPRKRLMLFADLVRLLALGSLGALLVFGTTPFWAIGVVAAFEGAGTAIFSIAQTGALRSVVEREQMPEAIASQTARNAASQLAGPSLGGVLFSVARSLPFVADSVSYALSSASLLLMRTPFEEERAAGHEPLRTQVAAGFRFLWNQPFLRTCAPLFALLNFVASGVLFSVVVIAKQQGLPSSEVGALAATFAVGVIVGAAFSSRVRARLPRRAVLLLELWAWLGCSLFLLWPSIYVLVVSIIPSSLVVPSTDSLVHATRIAITPDQLLGRSEAAWRVVSLCVSPLGPLLAGIMLEVSERAAIGLFASVAVVLVTWAMLSKAIRVLPSAVPSGENHP